MTARVTRSSANQVAPIEFGDLTIQQIVAIGGGPPPSTFMPLTAGDITIN